MDVPYVNLAAEQDKLKHDLERAICRVLASGSYVLGENVSAFEEEFGSWLGARQVVTVGSGTDAIYLALKALGVGAGHEVITVSHTAVNTALAISKTGAQPVFIDIEPETYCMDPAGLEAALSPRTRAVIPVHLYGQPVDLDHVLEFAGSKDLPVIEDCAQAHGAVYKGRTVGTIGAAGCFSFYPTKNLGACGDGGAVVTGNRDLADRIRSLANCGQGGERYLNIYKGDVSRLDELQAAILRVKLEKLDEYNSRRREIARIYFDELSNSGLILPRERDGSSHVYHLYVVRSERRDELKEFLAGEHIQAMVHYPIPAHMQPAYAGVSTPKLPVTEMVVKEILSLPVFPEIQERQLKHVAGSVLRFQMEA